MSTPLRTLLLLSCAIAASAQTLDPALLLKPLGNDWPTYSGDYSGQRYSRLTQINQSNVRNLSLAWTTRVSAGPPSATGGRGGFGGFGQVAPPTIAGGEGSDEVAAGT